jgi:ribonuclease P protein component
LAEAPGSRLQGHERLRAGRDFRRAFSRGLRLDGRHFVLVAVESRLGYSRLGLAVGRKVGTAVTRNRVKRLLREVYRRNRSEIPWPGDLVVVAKQGIAAQSYHELEGEFRQRMRRLAVRQNTGRARPDGSH